MGFLLQMLPQQAHDFVFQTFGNEVKYEYLAQRVRTFAANTDVGVVPMDIGCGAWRVIRRGGFGGRRRPGIRVTRYLWIAPGWPGCFVASCGVYRSASAEASHHHLLRRPHAPAHACVAAEQKHILHDAMQRRSEP